jgi:hypothetical protein
MILHTLLPDRITEAGRAAQRLDYPPLMTLDADIALPGGLKVKGQDIHDRLTANGFRAELLGRHKPPATPNGWKRYRRCASP